MINNELLQEKWRVQKKMAKATNHNIDKMLNNAEESVARKLKEHNVKLQYSNRCPFFQSDAKM